MESLISEQSNLFACNSIVGAHMKIWDSIGEGVKKEGYLTHGVDALTEASDEGRRRLRKASGSCQPSFDPGMSEWGNPSDVTSENAV